MKRVKDRRIPLELDILRAAHALLAEGEIEFYGHLLAKQLGERYNPRKLVGYGTLYKALERLEAAGFLESAWEDPLIAAEECRPRRRLYRLRQDADLAVPVDIVEAVEDPRIAR